MKACEGCGNDLPDGAHVNRRFCDACNKAKRIAIVSACVARWRIKHRERYLQARRDFYYRKTGGKPRVKISGRERAQRLKIRRQAREEANERGLPVETILQQWGAR
jgi:hypothetical protein